MGSKFTVTLPMEVSTQISEYSSSNISSQTSGQMLLIEAEQSILKTSKNSEIIPSKRSQNIVIPDKMKSKEEYINKDE